MKKLNKKEDCARMKNDLTVIIEMLKEASEFYNHPDPKYSIDKVKKDVDSLLDEYLLVKENMKNRKCN